MRLSTCSAIAVLAAPAAADDSPYRYGGHTKVNLTAQRFPADSLFRDLLGSTSTDLQGDLRLNLEWRDGRWSAEAAYQLTAIDSDGLGQFATAGLSNAGFGALPNDDRRLLDLTSVIADSSDSALLHRLDRLWAGYTSDNTVLRFGRQALSWGNGFFYAPMDLVNPFDPAAIDTEYKAGDDMIYAQYLRDSGDDIQAAIVFRRNPLTGDIEEDQATAVVKYHGFVGEFEYDLLAGSSYGDAVAGIGAGRSIGGAVWSADLVITDADSDSYVQLVTNLSYSWVLADRNMSGLLEYHYNGVGQRAGRYAPADLAGNPDLVARLIRGQSFTLGRHYLAASVTIEMTPLWNLTPVVLANLADPSTLLQITSSYSLSDNMTLLGNLNLPVGANGTEFGGIDAGLPGRYLSSTAGLFMQFAWYF